MCDGPRRHNRTGLHTPDLSSKPFVTILLPHSAPPRRLSGFPACTIWRFTPVSEQFCRAGPAAASSIRVQAQASFGRRWKSGSNKAMGTFSPWVHGLIAELEAMAGHVDEALATVDQGLALAEETGEHWKDPLLFRRKGEFSSGAILPIPPLPRKPSRGPSPSPSSKVREAMACAPRSRSPNSANRPAAPPKPAPSSGRRSKAFRRRPRCLRSPRRWRCYRDCLRVCFGRRSGNTACVYGRFRLFPARRL